MTLEQAIQEVYNLPLADRKQVKIVTNLLIKRECFNKKAFAKVQPVSQKTGDQLFVFYHGADIWHDDIDRLISEEIDHFWDTVDGHNSNAAQFNLIEKIGGYEILDAMRGLGKFPAAKPGGKTKLGIAPLHNLDIGPYRSS